MASGNLLTGYGPSSQWQNLAFDGDERNFETWEVKILGYMKLRKLKEILVGTDDPADEDKNETAFAELIQFLDERSLSLVIREAKDDGRKAFKILREFYAGSSKPRVIALYNQLTTLVKRESESVTDYMIRAEKAAFALRSADEQVSDALFIAMTLKGLPDDYKAFVAITTQSETVDTFQKFKQALRNFDETEKACSAKPKGSNDSIMKSKSSGGSKPIICFNCNIAGHKAVDCRKPPREKKWCNFCKSSTHTDKSCRKQNRDHTKKAICSEYNTFAFKFDESDSPFLRTKTENLLVDCGATAHIVNTEDNFLNEDPTFKPEDHYVELADGSRKNNVAIKRGTAVVSLRAQNGELHEVKLENTLCIPTYPQNIFSVQAATQKGVTIKFCQNHAELVASDGTKFPIEQHGRLYYLYKNSVIQNRSESLETWHKILGHCNTSDIAQLEDVVHGMRINNRDTFDCETCILAKQSNTRNHQPDPRATKPFELIHTDLAGPIEPVAKEGYKYTMIFTDDYSVCLFTYFLKSKSDAPKVTEKFLADVAPYGKVKTLSFLQDLFPSGEIKRVRSDNGGEYISTEFKEILLKHSIKHELSAPYSPHQNGTAERNWRTLFEMARGMLIESGLPKFLWTYAVMAATYIRNRCYVKRIKTTPYGLITGVKPNVAKLHIFGTICYAYLHGQRKLDPHSKRGYFIGYDEDSPAYLIYYPENRTVAKHRLVKFIEMFENKERKDFASDLFPNQIDVEGENIIDEQKPQHDESEHDSMEKQTNIPERYPRRNRKPPDYLEDYYVDNDSYDYCYLLNAPATYHEAMRCEDAEQWTKAMDEEIETLQKNETFSLSELPKDKTAVGGKWVYAIKGNKESPVYKARYVARGFSQVEGIDFTETFSPTARMESIRMLIQLAIQNDWLLQQMDVKGAYLHAPIECDVYVTQPQGYQRSPNLVWKLKNSLYGLKQSGRNWHNLLHQYLKELNFVQSTADPCVFIQNTIRGSTILLVWVDDIIITSSSEELMDITKSKLKERFNMKDLGEVSSFLRIDFQRTNKSITMSQSRFLKEVLTKFGYDQCKPRTTPCEFNPDS